MPRYWTPAAGLVDISSGIGILDNPANPGFYGQVDAGLRSIYGHPAGQAVIDGLIQRRINQQKFTSIKPPRNGGDANECQCLGGDDARTPLTLGIGTSDHELQANCVRVALGSSGHHNDYAWLATELNTVPRYNIVGIPSNTAGNYGILPADVQRWLTGERPMFNPFQGPDLAAIKNALQVVIQRLIPNSAGPGAHSVVYWNPVKTMSRLTTRTMTHRAAFIGLAHELTHAYHNSRGTQLSWSEDGDHPSTVLYEYMCVGLGPWEDATVSENAIREEHFIASRQAY